MVNFDARKILIAEKTDHHTMEEMVFMYDNGTNFRDKYEAILFASKETTKSELAQQLLLKAMDNDYYKIREIAVSKYDKFDSLHIDKLNDKLTNILKSDTNSNVRSNSVAALTSTFTDSLAMINLFEEQLKVDSSYAVIGELISSIFDLDSAKGLHYANEYQNSESIDILLGVANIYSIYSEVDDAIFFEHLYYKSTGFSLYRFITYYLDYLCGLDDIVLQKKGLAIIEKEASNKTLWFARYAAIKGLVDLRDEYELKYVHYIEEGDEALAEEYAVLNKEVVLKLEMLKEKEINPSVITMF